MPSLDLVAHEWEKDAEVRDHLRKAKKLLKKEAWEETVEVDIPHAAMNYNVLKPLVKRLRDDSGEVGMHGIQPIITQKLFGYCHSVFFLFSTLHSFCGYLQTGPKRTHYDHYAG